MYIRRLVDLTTMEKKPDYRIIELEVLDPHIAMALEEVCLISVKDGGDPIIHFWKWDRAAVTIGSFQMLEDEVYTSRCRKDGISVIRRISGGGTMFHEPEQEFIFSITASAGELSKDIPRSYREVLEPIRKGLKDLGIHSDIEENNLMVNGKKISGSSQRRTSKAILHHGTILHDVNPYRMLNYIKGDKVVPSGKGTCSNYRPVTCVLDHVDISMDEVYEKVLSSLMDGRKHHPSGWTRDEVEMAKDLVENRYSRDEWNLKI